MEEDLNSEHIVITCWNKYGQRIVGCRDCDENVCGARLVGLSLHC